jgi:hypothetical protein
LSVERSRRFSHQSLAGSPASFKSLICTSGKKFQIFVIEGKDQSECREMIEKYEKQAENLGKKSGEGLYRFKDRYHGEVDFHWQGRYIWGIMNLTDPNLRPQYLKQLEILSKK